MFYESQERYSDKFSNFINTKRGKEWLSDMTLLNETMFEEPYKHCQITQNMVQYIDGFRTQFISKRLLVRILFSCKDLSREYDNILKCLQCVDEQCVSDKINELIEEISKSDCSFFGDSRRKIIKKNIESNCRNAIDSTTALCLMSYLLLPKDIIDGVGIGTIYKEIVTLRNEQTNMFKDIVQSKTNTRKIFNDNNNNSSKDIVKNAMDLFIFNFDNVKNYFSEQMSIMNSKQRYVGLYNSACCGKLYGGVDIELTPDDIVFRECVGVTPREYIQSVENSDKILECVRPAMNILENRTEFLDGAILVSIADVLLGKGIGMSYPLLMVSDTAMYHSLMLMDALNLDYDIEFLESVIKDNVNMMKKWIRNDMTSPEIGGRNFYMTSAKKLKPDISLDDLGDVAGFVYVYSRYNFLFDTKTYSLKMKTCLTSVSGMSSSWLQSLKYCSLMRRRFKNNIDISINVTIGNDMKIFATADCLTINGVQYTNHYELSDKFKSDQKWRDDSGLIELAEIYGYNPDIDRSIFILENALKSGDKKLYKSVRNYLKKLLNEN